MILRWLSRFAASLQKPDAFEEDHLEQHRQTLLLHDRFDRLLVHYGLDDLVGWPEIPADQCYLMLIPLLEAQKKEIEELRAKVIWGDCDTKG